MADVLLDQSLFDALLAQAAASPRLRSHLLLHASHDEPVQRVCIALQPGTYVRPHCHRQEDKRELLLMLQGRMMVVTFSEDGRELNRHRLETGGALCALEFDAHTWHSLYPLDGPAVVMEIKPGPYRPEVKTDFAPWAPAEGDAGVAAFLQQMQRASPSA